MTPPVDPPERSDAAGGADAAAPLRLLADPGRLRVVAALLLGERTAQGVAQRTGLGRRAVAQALTRLAGAGVVEGDQAGWTVREDRIRAAARASAPPPAAPAADEREAVLRAFLRDGRLTRIPSARTKRLVVLDHLSRLFEPGRRYSEREVNAYLRALHPDVAALRRYLVDEEFLTREAGVYWRSGGTFEV